MHIGNIIKEILQHRQMKVKHLARRLGLHHQAVYRMLKKKDIHPARLRQISKVLSADLLAFYNNPSQHTHSHQVEIAALNKQVAELEKENTYLKQINSLLQQKRKK